MVALPFLGRAARWAEGASGDGRNRVRNFRLVQPHLLLAALLPGAAFLYSAGSSSWSVRVRRFGGAAALGLAGGRGLICCQRVLSAAICRAISFLIDAIVIRRDLPLRKLCSSPARISR